MAEAFSPERSVATVDEPELMQIPDNWPPDDDDDTHIHRNPPPKPRLTLIPDLAIEFSQCNTLLEAEMSKRVKAFLNVQDESVTSRCHMGRQRAAGWSAPLPSDPQKRAEHLAARERGFQRLQTIAPTGPAISFGIWVSADLIRSQAYLEWTHTQKHFDVNKPVGGGISVTGSYDLENFGPIDFEPQDGIAVGLEGYVKLFIFGWFPIMACGFKARNKEKLSADDSRGVLTCATYDSSYPTISFGFPTIPAIRDAIRDALRPGLTICPPLIARLRLDEIPVNLNGEDKRLIFKYESSAVQVESDGVIVGGSVELKDPLPPAPAAAVVGPDEVWAKEDDQEASEVYSLQTTDLTAPLAVQWSSSATVVPNNPPTLVELRFNVSKIAPGHWARHWVEAEVTRDAKNLTAKAPRKQIVVYRQKSVHKP